MSWQEVRGAFDSDGALRDIYVLGASLGDWNTLLASLRGWEYAITYTVDGESSRLPAAADEIVREVRRHLTGRPE